LQPHAHSLFRRDRFFLNFFLKKIVFLFGKNKIFGFFSAEIFLFKKKPKTVFSGAPSCGHSNALGVEPFGALSAGQSLPGPFKWALLAVFCRFRAVFATKTFLPLAGLTIFS